MLTHCKGRLLLALVGLFIVINYSVAPLVARKDDSADICCSTVDQCPTSSGCRLDSSPCSSEAEGYCIPIE